MEFNDARDADNEMNNQSLCGRRFTVENAKETTLSRNSYNDRGGDRYGAAEAVIAAEEESMMNAAVSITGTGPNTVRIQSSSTDLLLRMCSP